jgi:hypothetical protein
MAEIKEVSLEDILAPEKDFREEEDPEHLRFIAQSVLTEGGKLRRPIDVRRKDGKYQILTGQGLTRYQALLSVRPKIETTLVAIHELDDPHAAVYGLGEDAATKQHTPKEKGNWVRYILNQYGVTIDWVANATGIPNSTIDFWLGKTKDETVPQVNKEPQRLEDLLPNETEGQKAIKSKLFDAIIGDFKDKFEDFRQHGGQNEEGLEPVEALNQVLAVGFRALELKDLEAGLEPHQSRIEKIMEAKKMGLATLIVRAVDVYLTEEGF